MIRHAIIQGASSARGKNFTAYGGIAVHHSKLTIENTKLLNFSARDAINAFHSELYFLNSHLEGAQDDALDCDFSVGAVKHSTFSRNGGDSVDLNQCYMIIENNKFLGGPDKAVSVGEKSVAYLANNQVKRYNIGFALKDSSLTTIDANEFENNKFNIATFIKKPWYGKPELIGQSTHVTELGYQRY